MKFNNNKKKNNNNGSSVVSMPSQPQTQTQAQPQTQMQPQTQPIINEIIVDESTQKELVGFDQEMARCKIELADNQVLVLQLQAKIVELTNKILSMQAQVNERLKIVARAKGANLDGPEAANWSYNIKVGKIFKVTPSLA